MLENEINALDKGAELMFENEFGTIYVFKSQKVLLCRLNKPYVPIDQFKSIFQKMTDLAGENSYEKFIFDKRNLQAFHQPSMEWYFTVWKKDMLDLGLKTHRKLMPGEVWFEQAVAAGRARILAQYPDTVVNQLDIGYKNSLEEAFYN